MEVVEADSGFAALDYLDQDDNFDCILLDYSMPGLNGGQTLDKIRGNGLRVPVVICTGFMKYESPDEANKFEPNARLTKPYTIDTLISTIESVCELVPSSDSTSA